MDISGDLNCSGAITCGTKCFLISNPDPAKTGQMLRHWSVESSEPGGSLPYRKQIDAIHGNTIISMPSWFKHLTIDVLCFASPVRHFGLCWADLDSDDANQIILGTSKAGMYNVMITAKRNDHCATQVCPQEVEFTPPPAEPKPQGFLST